MSTSFQKRLRQVGRRMHANVLLKQLGWMALLAGVVVAGGVLADRLAGTSLVDGVSGGILAGAALVAGVGLYALRRPRKMDVACALDDRLRLRERVSTALALADSDDPFARAAVAEAHSMADRFDGRRAFPVRPTRRWLVAGGVWLAVVSVALFVPTVDVFGGGSKTPAVDPAQQQQAQAQVSQVVQQAKSSVNKLGDPELAKELSKLDKGISANSPEEVRREAIRKLGDLADRIKKMGEAPDAEAARAIRKMMRGLRSQPEMMRNDIARAMAQGDFERASELMEELREKIEKGELTKEDIQKMASEMGKMSEKLSELAQENKQLEDALSEAGLDKELANKSESELESELEKQGLSEEQIQDIMDKKQAQQQAQQKVSELAQQCGECSQSGQDGELSESELEQMKQLAEQLEDLQEMQEAMEAQEDAIAQMEDAMEKLGDCNKPGNCPSCGQPGCKGQCQGLVLRRGQGQVAGGRGAGVGHVTDSAKGELQDDPNVKYDKYRDPVKHREDGKMIAGWYIKGKQVKGESKAELAEVVTAGKDRAADAIKDNRVPRKYEKAIQDYYGGMEKQAGAAPKEGSAEEEK